MNTTNSTNVKSVKTIKSLKWSREYCGLQHCLNLPLKSRLRMTIRRNHSYMAVYCFRTDNMSQGPIWEFQLNDLSEESENEIKREAYKWLSLNFPEKIEIIKDRENVTG